MKCVVKMPHATHQRGKNIITREKKILENMVESANIIAV